MKSQSDKKEVAKEAEFSCVGNIRYVEIKKEVENLMSISL